MSAPNALQLKTEEGIESQRKRAWPAPCMAVILSKLLYARLLLRRNAGDRALGVGEPAAQTSMKLVTKS